MAADAVAARLRRELWLPHLVPRRLRGNLVPGRVRRQPFLQVEWCQLPAVLKGADADAHDQAFDGALRTAYGQPVGGAHCEPVGVPLGNTHFQPVCGAHGEPVGVTLGDTHFQPVGGAHGEPVSVTLGGTHFQPVGGAHAPPS